MMNAIYRNDQNSSGMIVNETFKTKRLAVSDNDSSRCSRNEDNGNTSKQSIAEGKTCKQTTDVMLLRQTTASIADALLRLGGTDDSSDTSSCVDSKKKRKRSVSLAEDSDCCSTGTQSIDTETDVSSTGTTKRHRSTPSQELSMVPTKLYLAAGNTTSLQDDGAYMDSNLAASESKIDLESTDIEIPGSIGCISQMFHQDFRPLPAAPRLPKGIVAESIPPMHSIYFPQTPSSPKGTMYSTEITEHNNCLIMHSYAVLPRPIPYQMTQIQVPNAY